MAPRSQKTADIVAELKADPDASCTSIAAKFAVTISYIGDVRRRYGIPRSKPRRKIASEKVTKKVVAMYLANIPVGMIASHLNCQRQTIIGYLNRAGCAYRQQPRLLEGNKEVIRRFFAKGVSRTEIAKRTGVPYPTVVRIIAQALQQQEAGHAAEEQSADSDAPGGEYPVT